MSSLYTTPYIASAGGGGAYSLVSGSYAPGAAGLLSTVKPVSHTAAASGGGGSGSGSSTINFGGSGGSGGGVDITGGGGGGGCSVVGGGDNHLPKYDAHSSCD